MFRSGFDFETRRGRLFKKGDLKYIILDQLKDKPAHGYEITRGLEERFHGLYTPSAGSVYPILQLLQDMGYVTSVEKDGKKVFTITEAGRRFLSEQQETTDSIKKRTRGWMGPDNREYLHDVKKALDDAHAIRHMVGEAAVQKNPEKVARIAEIMEKARAAIEAVVDEE
jgi:DNA-binding PadR family transcriptional regulator